jgi:hypothetical protein
MISYDFGQISRRDEKERAERERETERNEGTYV